jgi:hypothetical protein
VGNHWTLSIQLASSEVDTNVRAPIFCRHSSLKYQRNPWWEVRTADHEEPLIPLSRFRKLNGKGRSDPDLAVNDSDSGYFCGNHQKVAFPTLHGVDRLGELVELELPATLVLPDWHPDRHSVELKVYTSISNLARDVPLLKNRNISPHRIAICPIGRCRGMVRKLHLHRL